MRCKSSSHTVNAGREEETKAELRLILNSLQPFFDSAVPEDESSRARACIRCLEQSEREFLPGQSRPDIAKHAENSENRRRAGLPGDEARSPFIKRGRSAARRRRQVLNRNVQGRWCGMARRQPTILKLRREIPGGCTKLPVRNRDLPKSSWCATNCRVFRGPAHDRVDHRMLRRQRELP